MCGQKRFVLFCLLQRSYPSEKWETVSTLLCNSNLYASLTYLVQASASRQKNSLILSLTRETLKFKFFPFSGPQSIKAMLHWTSRIRVLLVQYSWNVHVISITINIVGEVQPVKQIHPPLVKTESEQYLKSDPPLSLLLIATQSFQTI